MSSDEDLDILEFVKIVEQGELSSTEIMKKYKINSYRFYKMLHEYDLKPKKNKTGKCGPKNTKFKKLLYGTEEEQKAAKILPECLVIDDFVADSKNGMKITDLMVKYNLTLYQIRELRKKHELNKMTLMTMKVKK